MFTCGPSLFGSGQATPTGHRYWRFHITEIQTSGTRAAISELVFKTSPGGAQAGTYNGGGNGILVTDSSNFGGFTGGSCFNGTITTSSDGWISNATDPAPDWVRIDYGAGNEKSIVEYTVYNAHGAFMPVGSSPKSWTLQYSDNDSTWTTADTQTGVVWASHSLSKTYSVA